MTIKDKIIFLTLSIITLGIYPYIILKGAHKEKSAELSISEKVSINIDDLFNILGKENIVSVTNTHTKVKIEIKPGTKIDANSVKSLKGISGVFATSSSLSILVGNSAKIIADAIEKRI